MLEIYKSMNHLNPSYIWHIHERKEIQYDLRTKHLCKIAEYENDKIRHGVALISHLQVACCGTILTIKSRSYQQLQTLKQRSQHGWVKNVIAKSANSLSITLCSRSLYILLLCFFTIIIIIIFFLEMFVNYDVNSWYYLVYSYKLCNTNFR